ncbi:invasin domain 3-containing protein [Yersinia wautersii]|uniref:invasin domain 3-containing protein n=1 Tax=Yersinia pseudotuberculosis TaxID=633 RepID=UPI0015F12D5C|nr:invasin domain 3-containing protein [Yersinia pseudotuberculosis]
MVIIFQLFFPIVVVYTPTVIASVSPTQSVTEPYILSYGETTASIAKEHQISINKLQEINRFRIFKVPFDSLVEGDEIDIPKVVPLSSMLNESIQPTEIERKLAYGAMATGELFSRQDSSHSAGQKVKSVIVNEANQSIQEWLGQFGTARVQLNIDDDFSLDNSALDFLIPLYDGESSMLFTQLGARNKDSRNTINIGTGVRIYTNKWMYGVNTFFDNDVTGHNKRVGIGAEAWTDYLKFSTNGYFGTTNWHQSRDFEHYNERPADGYDIRAEAYIPSYAQFGGKLMYEKYKGDDVALFGKDNRQRDPYAITAGVNYTPIPLVTLGIDHRVGKSSYNDTRFNLQFNYHLGESWAKQISPSAVTAARTLAGSRYDLVERNNNIVLDYQKRTLIHLTLPEQLVGVANDTAILTAQVVAHHGVDRIDWDAGSLVAAGGRIDSLSSHVIQVTYPPHQLTRNTYTLYAVAHDTRGNASNQATTLIKVNAPDLSTTNSTLIATPDSIVANGSDTSIVTLTLRDGSNSPVTGQSVAFTSTLGDMGTVTEGSDGVYTATLTAGTVAGIASITARVGGTSFSVTPATVSLSWDLSITNSTLIASPDSIVANGSDTSIVTLTLRDGSNSPVTGQSVAFTSTLGDMGTVTEGSDGVYTATLTAGTVAGIASITARVGGTSFSVTPATVSLSWDLSITNSTLIASPDSIVANGSDTSIVTLTLRDGSNSPVTGQSVAFTSTLGDMGTVTEGSDGVYTATLTAGTVAGIASVTARVGGTSFSVTPATVSLSWDLSITNSTLIASPDSIVANGSDTSIVTLTLRDGSNSPVTGQSVAFTSTLGDMGTVTEGSDGVYTATLTAGTVAGIASITARVGGTSFSVTPATVSLSWDLSITNSTLIASPDSIVANGSDTSTLLLTLVDSNHGPVTGQNVTFSTTMGDIGVTTSPSDGIYIATLTAGTVVGTALINVIVDGIPFGVTPVTVLMNGDSGDLSNTNSTLLATPSSIVANGSDTSTVTLALRDGNNSPVIGQSVTFTPSLGNMGTITESSNGVYTATLTAGTVAGIATITASVIGSSFSMSPTIVTLSPDVMDVMNSELTVSTDSINADDRTGAVITFLARDVSGNSISGLDISFTTDLTNSQITNMSYSDNSYTANLDGTKVGVANISVKLSGAVIEGFMETVTITPGAWNPAQVPEILSLREPGQMCTTQDSGGFTRLIMFVDGLTLYDNYDNETTGVMLYNMSRFRAVTANASEAPTINPRTRMTLPSDTLRIIFMGSEAFTTETQCITNGFIEMHGTVTATQVTDSFGTTPINRVFTIGNGS